MGADAPVKIFALLYHVQIKQDADSKKSNERKGGQVTAAFFRLFYGCMVLSPDVPHKDRMSPPHLRWEVVER